MKNHIQYMEDKMVNIDDFLCARKTFFPDKKVVFTNGCFDILHAGHVEYLAKARNLGDLLVVGLNTDCSVTKLKGPSRPVNHQLARAKVLSALESVDYVIFFEEETPFHLIQNILPDILVKGSDYKIEKIVGAELVLSHGGSVKTIDFVEGFSTTHIVEKLK
ncbi:MAG: D-glycero-beta-D-manno-heptose 1-phosphate adenylyltransferase [Bacteroidales bacterium]